MIRMRDYALRAMQGSSGVGPALMRAALAVVEPVYAAAVTARNHFYDLRGGMSLARPAISVGNITTGGTGKTPVVRWLAEEFRCRGLRTAILLRGYRGGSVGATQASPLQSDEQLMLD